MPDNYICPQDGAPLKLRMVNRLFFTCGHKYSDAEYQSAQNSSAPTPATPSVPEKYLSITKNLVAYDYQQTGVDFALTSAADNPCGGVRVLFADDMGLGKTIQLLLTLRNGKEMLPALILVKSATTINWLRETIEWLSDSDLSVFVIQGGAKFIPPGFSVYIMSIDSLSRNVQVDEFSRADRKYISKKKERAASVFYRLKFNSIVIDECHSFKDTSTARYQALKTYLDENPVPNRMGASGTPIKNRADEYFPILHTLRPDLFPFFEHFKRAFLQQDSKGRWSRIRRNKLPAFRALTEKFIIRRDRTILNLPAHTHRYKVIEIEDERVKKAYNQQLDLFQLKVDSGEASDPISRLAELAKLRRICGMAKVPFMLELAEEFFESASADAEIDPEYPQKLAVGVHHHDVTGYIKLLCEKKYPEINFLSLDGSDSATEKDRIIERFRYASPALLSCSTLAGGVGLNIQFCANYFILESEWSPADENQFIGRFHRNGQTYPVMGTTIVVAGTVDDFFEEIKKEKKKIFGETIEGWSLSADAGSLNRLVKETLANRL